MPDANANANDVVCWVSPQDGYPSFAAVLVDLATVRAAFPGRTIRVAIPTAYGRYLQGEMERPYYRTLGDELCPSTLAGYADLRARFEDAGYPCDSWSVPRGNTGDDRAEGNLHGNVAAAFARHYINFEAGWPRYWTKPLDVVAANDFLGGFWATADPSLNGNVGLTWVTNSMLAAVPDDAKLAWIGGSNYDLLEAYAPGDPNLDPDKALEIWTGTLGRLAIATADRPVYLMVKLGIAGYVAAAAANSAPIHLWTLQSVQDQCLAIIAANPAPAPAPAPDYQTALSYITRGAPREAISKAIADLTAVLNEIDRVGEQFLG